jgi:hypothetical protein
MSEWLKEHAWKSKRARNTEQHRNTSLRDRFNKLPPRNAPRCDSVSVGILRRFRPHLTQFLHSSQLHLSQHVATFRGTRRYAHRTRRSDVITRASSRTYQMTMTACGCRSRSVNPDVLSPRVDGSMMAIRIRSCARPCDGAVFALPRGTVTVRRVMSLPWAVQR